MPALFQKTLALGAVLFSAFATVNAQSVKATITLPGLPEEVAVDYIANRVYVAVPSFGGPTDTLLEVDPTKHNIGHTITIPPVGFQVALDVIRKRAYVGGCYTDSNEQNDCEVAVVDILNDVYLGKVLITHTEGYGIAGLAVDQLTGTLYVSNASDNVIDVVRYETGTPGAKLYYTIGLDGQSPANVSINPFTNKLYVALSTDLVDVIDTQLHKIVATTTVGTSNNGIAVNTATGNVFVTNNVFGVSTTGVLNAAGNVLANVTVGNTPFEVVVDPLTNLAFVTNTTDFSLSVINGATNTVTATLPVSGTFMDVNPFTSTVFVSGQNNSLIEVQE